jgi:hypothetical protein
LPEFMPEAEFKRRFGGIDAPAYKRMMDDIERRIAALPLYRRREPNRKRCSKTQKNRQRTFMCRNE